MDTLNDGHTSETPIRPVVRTVKGRPSVDGADVKLTRIIGSTDLGTLDPFLLLDAFGSNEPRDYIGGFPPHPHRGFETVTYLLAGRVRHRDSAGHAGLIEAGGVQWMTAGRGIVHSEMPEQEDGLLAGFQLWVNLPASLKMTEPRYQEFAADQIPLERRAGDVEARVIAGMTSAGTTGPIIGVHTDPLYLDVSLGAGDAFVESVPPSHSAFIYVVNGAVSVAAGHSGRDQKVDNGMLAVLGDGERIQLTGYEPTNRLLLVAGRRLNEPVARYGPFVMNTEEEVRQAIADYHAGHLGQIER